ncbi:ATP synthase subunit H-domain-containing protein [Lobosporangium transversale]|uniref:ATP synthase subunit H-domain-containing protein n=1 Tax=Lobosporangium transversale TaxID=64571 RepID=A0A1Y2GF87_9FUNG|nr:ATP synthase subunit H-domain-containing protein [Lobosporangium transversale]ORZ05970.1 ATP synthase subunit H-domain-containing protein [Lobosporangium transversale]|eukprot:XP_021877351.1 ATP synthase subunit H-domain-containing protein [Lobosporangium transversale]
MGGLLIVFVFAVVVALSSASYLFTPRGPNQTVIRTALIMTLVSCFLMWSITYLAQLHPLMRPRHSKIRPHNPTEHVTF